MKVYVAGKITGLKDYREKFNEAQEHLKGLGYSVMNPAVLEGKFTHDEFMHVCYSMIDVCDGVYFLNNWDDSKGAMLEHIYAIEKGKWIKYQE